MPSDTGAPWLLPYPEDTDLVRDGADDIEALAVATAAGLSVSSGLVAVKHVLKTDTQVEAGITGGNNFAVTGLSITHEVADASNKLIISAFFGAAATNNTTGQVGIALHDGTGLIGIGGASGSRSRITAGGRVTASGGTDVVTMPSVTFVHVPGTGSKTYTVRAVNVQTTTHTIFINREEDNTDNASRVRAVSALVIQEVRV